MYKYLHNKNSKAIFDEKTKQNIIDSLKKRRIYSGIIEFESEKELATKLEGLKKQSTNTLVIIGDDEDFNMLIGQIGKLEDEIAIGYLPLNKSKFSKKLKIRSVNDAINALAQRRIKETTLYSLSSRFFYDSIELSFGENLPEDKIIIKTSKNLELKLPVCNLRFENLNEDQYYSHAPIQITAYREKTENKTPEKHSIFQKILKNIEKQTENSVDELILSLHSKNFKVESTIQAHDSLNRNYNPSFNVGKSSKTIRLISKRPDIQK